MAAMLSSGMVARPVSMICARATAMLVDGAGHAPHARNAGIVLKDKGIPVLPHAYRGTGFGDDKSCPAAP